MQTFLPVASLTQSATCLDRARLGKQRVEVLQILQTLNNNSDENIAWFNHPAVLMWKNHPRLLILYGAAICKEWKHRGYKDSCLKKILAYKESSLWQNETTFPKWFGNDEFHRAHRSQLLRKDKEFYSQFGWKEVANQFPYVWGNCRAYLTARSYMYLCDKCFPQRPPYVSDNYYTKDDLLYNNQAVSCYSCGKCYILTTFAGNL